MSDKELWKQLKAGDRGALEKIYSTHFTTLYNYGKKLTSDQGTLEDSIQELFIEIWRNRENLSDTDAIKPYLLLSIRRKLFRSIKKVRSLTDKEITVHHFDAELAIDEKIIDNENTAATKKQLQKAMEQLSPRQKEILYLKYYSNMDYESIMEVMGLNYQSARNLVTRAIQSLSKYIQVFLIIFLAFDEYKSMRYAFYQ